MAAIAVIEFESLRADMSYDVRRERPQRLLLTMDECAKISSLCRASGWTDLDLCRSGDLQPGPFTRRFVQILKAGNCSIDKPKVEKLISLCERGCGLRWFRSHNYEQPQGRLAEPKAQASPVPAGGSWSRQADESIFRPRPNEDGE